MPEPKIKGGYILLSRTLIEDQIFSKPPLYLKVWVWLLSKATRKEHNGLKPGQVRTSYAEIIEAMTHWVGNRPERPDKRNIQTVIDWLKNPSDEAKSESTSKGTAKGTTISTAKVTGGFIITINKFEYYQNSKHYERYSESDSEMYGEMQAACKPYLYYDNRDKRDNKNIPIGDSKNKVVSKRGPRKAADVLKDFSPMPAKDSVPGPHDGKFPDADAIHAAIRTFFGQYDIRWPKDSTTRKHSQEIQTGGYSRDELARAFAALREKYSTDAGRIRMVSKFFSPGYELRDKLEFFRR